MYDICTCLIFAWDEAMCMYGLLVSVQLDLSHFFIHIHLHLCIIICIKWMEELCMWMYVIINCLLLWLTGCVCLNAKKEVGSRCLPGFGSGVVPVTWHCGGSLAPHRLQLLPGTPQASVVARHSFGLSCCLAPFRLHFVARQPQLGLGHSKNTWV